MQLKIISIVNIMNMKMFTQLLLNIRAPKLYPNGKNELKTNNNKQHRKQIYKQNVQNNIYTKHKTRTSM
jgi:hypothetical protein